VTYQPLKQAPTFRLRSGSREVLKRSAIRRHNCYGGSTFFQDGQGHLHAGRSGGVLYIAAFVVNCRIRMFMPFCLTQAIFILGWWLAFAKKEMPGTFGKTVRDPEQLAGLAVVSTRLATMSLCQAPGIPE
jgi:hypothetical protein